MATGRTLRAASGLAVLVAPLVAAATFSLALDGHAQASSVGTGCAGAYGWPVRPFDGQHPVRANFGDPRTRFAGAESTGALLSGDGTFSFHQGVDISAPDGAPVYAVASGTVTRARGGRVTVDCGNGRTFQYWHIEPAARAGQHAVAGKTLLGFVQQKREHVHLTHLERSRAVNPLARGGLRPYRDTTTPRVLSIASGLVGGRLRFVVSATDAPPLAVPGRWNGFPVTPALVSWRVVREGKVFASGVSRDVRRTVPRNATFWRTFARGTHQNWPIFAGRKLRGRPGTYLFHVAPSRLPAGSFTLIVVVADTAGNRDELRLPVPAPLDPAPSSR
jgi:hypothetical protein